MRRRHEEPKLGTVEVIVDERKVFDFFRWREAIKFWQDRIWSGRFNRGLHSEPLEGNAILRIHHWDMGPHIRTFLSVTYDADAGLYRASGHAHNLSLEELRLVSKGKFFSSHPDSSSIESTFARFARDRMIKAIDVQLSDPAHVRRFVLVNERGTLRIGFP